MVTMLDPFIQKILREIWARRILRPRQRVLLAVSGGADSMALLYLFNFLRVPLHLHVTVAHLDHALRKGARRDAQFVKAQCRALKIPVVTGRVDVRGLADKKRFSIEDAARRARYHFLVRVAGRVRARKIITAHTQDDQVETALLHLVRGAGLEGASAMAWIGPVATEKCTSVKLCRPMLGTTRDEIVAFLRRLHVTWREDPTNKSMRFKRNRVRHELIPNLKRYNPAVVERLAEFTEILGEEKIFLEREVQKAIVRCRFRKGKDEVSMRAREYHRSPGAVKRELFRLIVKKLKGDTGGFGFRHWKLFEEWTTDPSRRRPLQLPRGVLAEKQGDLIRMCFARRPGKAKPVLIKSAHSGRVTFAGRTVRFQVRSYRPGRLSAIRTIQGGAVLDLDKIHFPIRIRTRRPGDRFIPLGMEGSKKLQDFLVDAKVPRQERDGVPIFADRKRIIWVGGLRPADPVKVTPRTRRVLKFFLI